MEKQYFLAGQGKVSLFRDNELIIVVRKPQVSSLNFNIEAEEVRGGGNESEHIVYIPPKKVKHCKHSPKIKIYEIPDRPTLYLAYCDICNRSTYGYKTKEDAIRAWKNNDVYDRLI